MILLTITPIPNGYRLIATTTYGAARYRWTFYRNGILFLPSYWTGRPTNAVTVELHHPVLPGAYWAQVDHFGSPCGQSFTQPQAQYTSRPTPLPFSR